MPQVSWRRPNQLRDLMAVLELSATATANSGIAAKPGAVRPAIPQ
jgi:hypothetical protein